MKQGKFALVLVGALALTACESINSGLMGTQIDPDVDALCGNGIGRTVGSDYFASNGALFKATQVATGDSVYWQNGRTGSWGYYCPIRDGHTRIQGDYCREIMSTISANGRVQRIYNTICRRPNGTWYQI